MKLSTNEQILSDECRLTSRQAAVLASYMTACCVVVPRYYRPDCCIAFGKLSLLVLGRVPGCQARVLATTAVAVNEQLLAKQRMPESEEEGLAWSQEGCHSVIVGHPDDHRPGGWAGHLVVVAYERSLLDLTIVQASRPERGIRVGPHVAPVTPTFLSGDDRLVVPLPAGGTLYYESRAADETYKTAADWLREDRLEPLARTILDFVQRRLARS